MAKAQTAQATREIATTKLNKLVKAVKTGVRAGADESFRNSV